MADESVGIEVTVERVTESLKQFGIPLEAWQVEFLVSTLKARRAVSEIQNRTEARVMTDQTLELLESFSRMYGLPTASNPYQRML